MCKLTQIGVLCSLLLVLKPPFSHIPAVSICSRTDCLIFRIFSYSSVFVYLLIHLFVWTLCSVLYFFHPHLEIPRGICDQLIGRIRLQKLFYLYFLWPWKTECDSFVCPLPVCLLATSTWQSVPTCGLTALSPSTMEECPPSSTSPFLMEWVWLAGLLTRCAEKIVLFLFQRLLLFLASPEITHCLVIKK